MQKKYNKKKHIFSVQSVSHYLSFYYISEILCFQETVKPENKRSVAEAGYRPSRQPYFSGVEGGAYGEKQERNRTGERNKPGKRDNAGSGGIEGSGDNAGESIAESEGIAEAGCSARERISGISCSWRYDTIWSCK